MKPARWALAVVLVANAVAIVPAERERATPVGEFVLAVCREQVTGGWRDDEFTMMQLPLTPRMNGLGELVDDATLAALGFSAEARGLVGDTMRAEERWPLPRMAWFALRQQADSFRMLEVIRVAATREALAPQAGELAMRGLVKFEWVMGPPRSAADSVAGGGSADRVQEVGLGVLRLVPAQLGLDRAIAAQLRTLRDTLPGVCPRTVAVRLMMGRNGAVWIVRD